MKKIIASTVIGASLVSFASSAHAATATGNVNFRNAPTTKSSISDVIKKGEQVNVLKIMNKYWVKADYNGKVGYVSAKYIDNTKPVEAGKVTATLLNFRNAPSMSGRIMGTIKHDEEVQIIDRANKWWWKVKYNGKTGYVSVKYIDLGETSTPVNPTPDPEPEPPVTPPTMGYTILQSGDKYLGTPYLFGAKAGSGYFDCSLLVQTLFKENGISLPRNSRQQSTVGTPIGTNLESLRAGDLLFFDTNSDGVINHVGIYAGDGRLLNANSKGVVYSDYKPGSYYMRTVVAARRIL